MGIKKNILIDGKEVPFKASAAVPRLYRLKFGRDIYRDFAALQKAVMENSKQKEEQSEEERMFSFLSTDVLELFENISYIMARHADPENVLNNPDEWLEQFEMFSIYEVLPQLMELWGFNIDTQVQGKKNIAQLTGK
ncbi:MAG: hypothetical protein ACI4TG_09320 [Ruminococcus sp.]